MQSPLAGQHPRSKGLHSFLWLLAFVFALTAPSVSSLAHTTDPEVAKVAGEIIQTDVDDAFAVRAEFLQWAEQDRAVFIQAKVTEFEKDSSHLTAEQILILAEQRYAERLDQNRIEHHYAARGAARATMIDGQLCVRIYRKADNNLYIFLDEDKIAKDSKHLQTYINRQHVYKGRNVAVVWFKGEIPTASSYHEAPVKFLKLSKYLKIPSLAWLKKVPKAVYAPVKDRASNLLFAAGIWGAQNVFIGLINTVNVSLGHEWNWGLHIANALIAPPVAYYNSTYRNILDLGGIKWQAAFSTSIGLVGNYIVAAFDPNTGGWSQLFNIHDLNGQVTARAVTKAAAIHAFLLWNVFIDSYARTYWRQINKIFEDMRHIPFKEYVPINEKGNVVFHLGGRRFEINGHSTLYETLKLPSFAFKAADLTGIWVEIPGIGISLPLGKLAMIASIPPAIWGAAKVATVQHYDKAKRIVMRWEKTKDWLLLGPVRRKVSDIFSSATNLLPKPQQVAALEEATQQAQSKGSRCEDTIEDGNDESTSYPYAVTQLLNPENKPNYPLDGSSNNKP